MKRKTRSLTAVLLLIATLGTMMTGCGKKKDEPLPLPEELQAIIAEHENGNKSEEKKTDVKAVKKNGIQMENYITISVKGNDGSGKLYTEVDLERLYHDAHKFLIEDVNELPFKRPGCETVEDYLKDSIGYANSHGVVECEKVENLCNGDKLEIYVDLPDGLGHMVTVEASPSVINYTVKGLEKFEGIDPFEFASLSYSDFAVIDGEIGYKLHSGVGMIIRLPDEKNGFIMGTADVQEDKVYKRTDSVRVSVNPEFIQQLTEKYGSDVFACTEMDITLENIDYLPVGDNASDVFTCMGEQCMEKVLFATQEMMNTYTNTATTVENIGMMFFYDDEDVLESDDYNKYYNQIVFINKITNTSCPEGWYTYMAYNSAVSVGYEVNKETFEENACVGHIGGHCFENDYRRYRNEAMDIYKGTYPTTFDCNGGAYPGHRDLAEVFVALRTNIPQLDEYDHLIVTESLKDYVQEY